MANVQQEEDVWECAICLGVEDGRQREMHPCHLHEFHKECLKAAMLRNSACPMCRHKPVSATLPLVQVMTRHFGLRTPMECPACNFMNEGAETYYKFINCGHRIH